MAERRGHGWLFARPAAFTMLCLRSKLVWLAVAASCSRCAVSAVSALPPRHGNTVLMLIPLSECAANENDASFAPRVLLSKTLRS